jgi:Zn-dependent protease with chaperone function
LKKAEFNSKEKTIKCPSCSSEIIVNEGYVSWCEHCSWNLRPHEADAGEKTIVDSLYLKLGNKLGKDLYDNIAKKKNLSPKLTIVKVLAFLVSLLIHLISVANIFIVFYLLTQYGINIITIILSLFFFSLAYLTLPHFQKLPKDAVKREDFPALYKLVDDIAKAYSCKSIDALVIDSSFNAAYSEIGFKRKKVLYIGLPLFCILNNKEKVAIIGHELAHGINGDITRGVITTTAINTLIKWYEMTKPEYILGQEEGFMKITMLPINILLFCLSRLILLVTLLLVFLVYSDSQRAEYLADYLSSTISGTDAMKAMLNKLHYTHAYNLALQRTALDSKNANFFTEIIKQASTTPYKEIERIKRMESMEGSRLDATHPPTSYRTKFLDSLGELSPTIFLDDANSLLIDKELNSVAENLQSKLIDEYRESLY